MGWNIRALSCWEYAKQLVRCFKAEILDDLGLVPGKLQKEIQSDGWDRRLV